MWNYYLCSSRVESAVFVLENSTLCLSPCFQQQTYCWHDRHISCEYITVQGNTVIKLLSSLGLYHVLCSPALGGETRGGGWGWEGVVSLWCGKHHKWVGWFTTWYLLYSVYDLRLQVMASLTLQQSLMGATFEVVLVTAVIMQVKRIKWMYFTF